MAAEERVAAPANKRKEKSGRRARRSRRQLAGFRHKSQLCFLGAKAHTNHGGLAAAKMSRALDLLRDGIWILESDRTKECFFAPREIIEKCSSRESLQFICRHTFVLPSPACERNSWLDHYRPRQPSDLHATGSPIVVVVVVFVWLLSPQNLRSSSFV